MLNRFLKTAVRLLAVISMTSLLASAIATHHSEADVSVPKGIQDIVALVKQTAVDTKSRYS